MYNIKHKYGEKPQLRKTYTELEEAQYNDTRKIYVGKFGITVMILSAFLISIGSICSACPYNQETTLAWDGAGDKWTCGNCGTENYKWQGSCSNCGNSQ